MKRSSWHNLPFFLLFFWACSSLYAQLPGHIGVEDGLSQGWLTCLEQDEEGFIWIGTQSGLNRYEGARVRVYRHDPFDSLSLPGNFVNTLLDHQGFLLVGTIGNGMGMLHRRSGQFYNLPFLSHQDASAPVYRKLKKLPHPNVSYILLTEQGREIWITSGPYFSSEGSLHYCRMIVPENFWERLPAEPALLKQVEFECWRKTGSPEEEGRLRSLKDLILAEYDSTICYLDNSKREWIPYEGLSFSYGPETRLVTPPDRSFAIWQPSRQKRLFIEFPKGSWQQLDATGQARAFYIVHADAEKVLIKVDSSCHIYSTPSFLREPNLDLSSSSILLPYFPEEVLVDRSDNLFTTYAAEGLIKNSLKRKPFRRYFPGQSLSSTPLPDKNQQHYFFSYPLRFDGSSQNASFLYRLRELFAENEWYVNTILPGPTGDYWAMGTSFNKKPSFFFLKINPEKETIDKFEYPDRDPPIHLYRPNRLSFDASGRVWTAAEGLLICFDPQSLQWHSFGFQQLGLKGEEVFALAQTAPAEGRSFGSWWLATAKGLIEARPLPKESNAGATSGLPDSFAFFLHKNHPPKRNSLPHNFVLSLLTDPADPHLLWIGTKGGGLSSLDIRTGKFHSITTREGLPDDVIYGILDDDRGNLWMSSNRGLIRYTPADNTIKSYRKSDGLQEDEFNTWAYAKAKNGEMMFAGVNGLTVFHPDSIRDNPHRPPTFITGLKINNQAVYPKDSSGILDRPVEFTDQITLKHDQNDLTFEFAALDYTIPGQNQYRYYLEGAEEAWANQSNHPEATYLNLKPGRYTFRVLGSNNDEVFGAQPTQLSIRIRPPWYASPPARLAYLLLFTLIAVFVIRAYHRRLLTRKALALKEQKISHLQELHHQKLNDLKQKIIEKNELIIKLKEESSGKAPAKLTKQEVPKYLLAEIQILTKEDWQNFKELFDRAFPGFRRKVEKGFPALTPAELRLLLLEKMELSREDIAAVLGIAPDSVRRTRQRLEKKLQRSGVSVKEVITGRFEPGE